MSRFQFVDDHHTTHGVKRLCQVLDLNRSSFYRWWAGRDARAARRDVDKALVKRMREYHQEFDGTIGVRRMTIELNKKTVQPINHKRVERLMRTHNIIGVNLRKPNKTTVKDQGARVVDDFLKRKFRAEAPNQVYVGDITYLPCGQGQFLYLATVIDVCSRRLVVWSAGRSPTTCAPVSSKTPWKTRPGRGARWPGPYSTPTTDGNTPPQPSRPPVGGWEYASR